MRILISAAIVLVASGVTSVQPESFNPASSRPLPNVDAFLKKQIYARHIPGRQAAIVRHDATIWLENYGVSSIEHHIPVRRDSVFSINSSTKAFTGIAVLQLQEMGKLSIEDRIDHYLNDVPPAWGGLTVRQLLTHTSGLPDLLDDTEQIRGNGRESAAWEEVTKLPMVSAPGERFAYNQTGYALLGRIISRVSGQSFTAFVADRQFRPAGMTHTRFADSEDVVENSAGAYRRAPAADDGRGASGSWVVEFERFPTFLRPAAGIVSTAQDLAQWVVALRSGVLLKQADSLRELWEPVVLNNGALGGFNIAGLNGYALGWSAMVRNSHPAVAAMGGARAALYIYPCDDLAIIILTNLQGANPEEFIDTLVLSYRREFASRGIKPPATQEH